MPIITPLSIILLVTFLGSLETGCDGFRVLMVPMPVGSHMFSHYAIGLELLRRGHEVHLFLHLSAKGPKEQSSDGKEMVIHRYGSNSKVKVNIESASNKMALDFLTNKAGFEFTLNLTEEYNKQLFIDVLTGNEEVMEKLESLKFDIAVVDSAFFMKLFCLVAHRLRLPMITYSDALDPWLVRTPWLPSIFTPLHLTTDRKSTFYSRVFNTLLSLRTSFSPLIADPDEVLLNEYRKYGGFRTLTEVISKSVLYFTTDHEVLEVVRPTTANVIKIGGLTTEPWSKESANLTKNYLDFIDFPESKGTIVVSFGSMVPVYPEYLAKIFLEAFSALSQYRFIWRFTNSLGFSIPSNVMIVNWLPQKELLSHPSAKLFITHGGNNGQLEAIYYGVPMLAMPLFGDQPRNARRIAEIGYGEELDFRTADAEQCVNLIKKIIENPSYKSRVSKASEIFRSQTETPSERAAYWIEHVIKYGADHLRPAGNDLHIWQYLCLDVLLFIELFLLMVVVLFVLFLRFFLKRTRSLFQRANVSQPKKKMKKPNKKD